MDYELRKLTEKKRDDIIYTSFKEIISKTDDSNEVGVMFGKREIIISLMKNIISKIKTFDSKVEAYERACREYDEVLRDREERFAEIFFIFFFSLLIREINFGCIYYLI